MQNLPISHLYSLLLRTNSYAHNYKLADGLSIPNTYTSSTTKIKS